jgi:hypothetical protein
MILIKLLRALGLVTIADARRIEKSTIPLKTTSVMSAGLAFAALVVVAVIAGLQLELFTPDSSEIDLPELQTAPIPREEELDPRLLDEQVREDFRQKVVQLQVELERLQEYQHQIESQLAKKTVEATELDHLASLLQTELTRKSEEINTLAELATRRTVSGRSFSQEPTLYAAPSSDASMNAGFFDTQGAAVKRATQQEEFPADLVIDLTPRNAQSGDPYRLEVRLHNRGHRSLVVTGLELVWNYGGRNAGGKIPFQKRPVEPRSTALLHQIDGTWVEELNSGNITIEVLLEDGGRLTNTLRWQEG